MGQQFSATTTPIQQLTIQTNQLGITSQNALQRIASGGDALRQFSSQLGSTSTAMANTERSGSRLAELFRGNRGLVFGFSALFGTLTGIGFELQLVSDANKQVAESQETLNELVQRGLEGSAQYSQAQQALGKDMRFLEFSTRNLALAFTNLIPDVLLIANGILGLGEKMRANRVAQQELAATTRITTAEVKAVGIAAATSATPLGALGVGGRAAGVGMEQAAVGARILGISLRSLLISTGIGAALVALGFILEPIISNFMRSREASAMAAEGFSEVSAATGGVGTAVDSMASSIAQSNQDIIDTTEEMTESVIADYGKIVTEIQKFVPPAEKTTLTPKPEKKKEWWEQAGDILGGLGQTITEGLGFKRELPEQKTGTTTAKPFVPLHPQAGIIQPYVPSLTEQFDIDRMNVQTAEKLNQNLINTYTQPKGPFGKFKELGLDVPIDKIREYIDLQEQMNDALAKGDWTSYGVLADQLNKLVDPTDDLKKKTDDLKKAEEEKKKVYDESQKTMNNYNTALDKQPKLLQDTGLFTKQLSDQEEERIATIRAGAAVFLGWTQAQEVSLGVAEQVFIQGKKLTDGLIEQRDTIQATNLLWDNMNTIVAGTSVTMGEWIDKQQESIFAAIDVTKAITNQTYQTFLMKQGLIEGRLAAQQWIDSTYQAAGAEQELHDSTMEIVNALGVQLPEGIMLSTEQLQSLGEALLITGDTAAAKMEIMDQVFSETRGALEELVQAATQGGKDWREAWKDLDKDFIPKKERDSAKNFIEDLADVRQAFDGFGESVALFQQQWSFGMLNSREVKRWSEQTKEGLRGIRSEIEDLGPVGEMLAPQIVDPLMKLFKDGLTPAELNIISQFVNEYQRLANEPGGITVEALLSLKNYGERLLTAHENAKDVIVDLEDIEEAADKAGKKVLTLPSGIMTLSTKDGETPPATEDLDKELGTVIGDHFDPKEWDKIIEQSEQAERITGAFQSIIDAAPEVNKAIQGVNETLNKYFIEGLNLAGNKSAEFFKVTTKNIEAWKKAVHEDIVFINTDFNVRLIEVLNLTGNKFTELRVFADKQMNAWVKALRADITVINKDFNTRVIEVLNLTGNKFMELREFSIKQMAAMIAGIRPHVVTLDTYFGTTIPQAADAAMSAFEEMGSAAGDLESDLSSLESQAKATADAIRAIPSGAGGGGGGDNEGNQHGLHTTLDRDTWLLAHRGERVDIDTIGATQANRQKKGGSGGGDIVINFTNVTENVLDGQVIGTTVTKRTFRGIRTR